MNNYGFDYLNYITNIPGNMNNISDNFYNPYPINNTNTKPNQNNIIDPRLGFIRGNLFANLYNPYKNYTPEEPTPKNEKEALLYQIMQYKFALKELNLYLDTNPKDTNLLSLYNQYLNIEKQMCDKYEKMYGPLTTDSMNIGTNEWNWNNNPWPWEVK